MTKTRKRFLSIFLIIFIVLLQIPIVTFADTNYVAQIGTEKYETLTEAIEAVTNTTPTTIKIINDVINENAFVIGKEGAGNISILKQNITIDLNGHEIIKDNSTGNGSIFTILGDATLTIDDTSDQKRGLITSGNSGRMRGFDVARGTFVLKGGIITTSLENTTWSGGGVNVWKQGEFVMEGGTIRDCKAGKHGGGVNVGTDNTNGSTITKGIFTMKGGTIENCSTPSASGCGGGVYSNGTFTMNGGAIVGNVATDGGGVLVAAGGGIFNLLDGTISGNKANNNGGGVNVQGTFSMQGGVIEYNIVTTDNIYWGGGGVTIFNEAESTLSGGKIQHNSSANRGGGVLILQSGNSTKPQNVTMTGVSIINNTAEKGGGGVYFDDSQVTISLDGNTKIKDNESGGVENNFHFGERSNKLNLVGDVNSRKDMFVGVMTYTAPTESSPVVITTGGAAEDTKCFTSDNADYMVMFNTNRLELAKIVAYNYTKEKGYTTLDKAISEAVSGDEIELWTYENVENVVLPDGVTLYAKSGYTGTVTTNVTGKTIVKQDMLGEYQYKFFVADVLTITYKDQGNKTFSGTHESGYPTTFIADIPLELKSATKSNYTFGGWYDNADCTGETITGFYANTYTDDLTLYAKWIANEYKVTFDANGGTVTPENKNVIFESTYGDLPVPTKDGYTFDGWYTAKENGTKITSDTIVSITEAQTLYAKWINTYAVTFKDGENVLFTRSNITSGEKVTRPEADPSKEGYDFKGWYADATLTTEFDFNAPITQDTCVYAKYEKTQENPPIIPEDELKDIELDVTFNDFSGFVKINDKMNDGVSEAYSYIGTYTKVGYTTSDKTNKVYVIPSFGESRVKDVTINGTKYSRGDEGVEVSPEDGLIVTIAGAEKYTIIANPDKDAPTTRTIIWANSDYNEDAKPDDYNEDAVLKNGKARVIAIYDENGNKISGEQEVDENGLGFITASKNQKVVFEFTPNYGYQLTKILANGFELEPQDTLNQYVFTMPDTNVHFAATFTKVEDIVKADSKKVSSGKIILANNELDAGTARLSVKDIELSDDKVKEFKNAAGEYEIKSYLDIDLDQIFYKGSNDESDVWEKKIDTLSNKATITLKLADGITADDIVIVHNIHDGENYEIIEIEDYDPETNTITFKTNSFSNYAIATKTSSNTNNDTPTNTNDNPKTGDNIYVYISLMAFAMLGIIVTTKSLKKSR